MAVSSTIFKVFGMTRPGIEPRSPEPLANALPNCQYFVQIICEKIFPWHYYSLQILLLDNLHYVISRKTWISIIEKYGPEYLKYIPESKILIFEE